LEKEIVVLLHGTLTKEQRKIAQKKINIRPTVMVEAVKWLQVNNVEKKNVDLEKVKQNLEQPVILNRSRTVDDSVSPDDANVEKTDTFEIYFPDGTTTSISGGQGSMEALVFLVPLPCQLKNREGPLCTCIFRYG
jgi:hypothetical protein